MESTELTVRLIILFIPGIIATFIYGICQHRQDMSMDAVKYDLNTGKKAARRHQPVISADQG